MLTRRVNREIAARKSAEYLLEQKSLEVYKSNKELAGLNERLERTVQRRTNTLASLIKNLQTGILLEDENRKVLLTNQKFCDYFEIPVRPEELIGEDCSDAVGMVGHLLDDPEAFDQRINRLLLNMQVHTNEIISLKNGRVLKRDFIPIYSGREYLGHLWKYQDITKEYHYEERIRQSEEKYRGIIENMQLGLLEVDLDHNIIKAYDWFCGMTGYTRDELEGKNAIELLLPDRFRNVMDTADAKRANGEQSIYEVQLKRKDGSLIWVLVSGAPFYDNNGKPVGSIGIHYNITDRKELEGELRVAREMADNAREAEKQFLANMSHEIRNPINAIAGLINLLYDTELSKEQLDYLNSIKYAADILLGLISDILDISKIEAGKMELNEREIELSEVIKAVIQTSKFKSSNDQLKFEWQISPELNKPVIADPTVINQVFLNLMGNAIKFTEKGTISVKVEPIQQTPVMVTVKCTVKDTGIGISSEQMERIFESFRQASKQTKLKYGGTGLGLSIVRQLVQMYGGEINVHSEEGKGSEFVFTMNFKRAFTGTETINELPLYHSEVVSSTGRLLVVEDNKINQQYLTGLLKKWNMEFDIANNGAEAMELISKTQYSTVLMDIRMPVMDGYETTIRIRSSEHNPNQNVPIIALTASALVDEKERALAAGMNYHLTKPFAPNQLLNILNQVNEMKDNDDLKTETEDDKFEYSNSLDRQYLDTFYGDDLERASIMFGIFLKTVRPEVEKLRNFYELKDAEGIMDVAHRIKPNFAMVGLTEDTDKLNEIELAAIDKNLNKLGEELPTFFGEFDAKIKIVEEELSRIESALAS